MTDTTRIPRAMAVSSWLRPRRAGAHFPQRLLQLLWASCLFSLFVVGGAWALGEGEDLYNAGQADLAAARFEAAIEKFRQLSTQADQADRALYWVAYAEAKAGRKKAALATLARLQREFAKSPWLDDAKTLEVDLRGVDDPAQLPTEDEELKLYALNALHNVQPDKAIQLLGEFLRAAHSDRLKQQALWVLGQIDDPRAATLLLDLAKGRAGASPTLQREALRALAASGEANAVAALAEIYRSQADRELKKAVLDALVIAQDRATLLALVKAEKDPDLFEEGVTALGVNGGVAELRQLASSATGDAKAAIIRAIGIAGDSEALLEMIRAEKDPQALVDALDALALVEGEKVATELSRLYRERSEVEVRRAVLNAFFVQGNATALLEIFRQEKDRELRQAAFQFLTLMDDPAAEKLIENALKN